MSSQKISLDPTAADLTGTVYVPIVQNGINKKADPSLFGASQSLSSVLSVGNDAGGHKISNVGDPTQNQDVVTLAYFNQHKNDGSVISVSGTTNQISASTNSGAVTLSLPSALVFPGTWSIGTLGYSDTGILWSAQSSTNSYNQVIIQNTNGGSSASTNFLVSNDLGTANTHFLEIGKNSSGFSGSGSFNLANASYLDDASDDLVIGTLSNKTLHFVTNNSATDNLSITGAGVMTFNGSSTAIHKEIFNNISSTQTDGAGIWLQNQTAAINGTQQNSPAITWEGQGFATTPVASQTVKYMADVLPIQSAASPVATWRIRQSINGAAYSDVFTLTSSGTMTYTSGGSVVQVTGNSINMSGGTFNLAVFGNTRLSITNTTATFTQPAIGSGFASAIVSTPGAHTQITASTELVSRDFQGAVQQWTTGPLTTQRWNYFRGYTIAFSGTSVLMNGYTVFIDGPIAGGSNATTTNPFALGLNGNLSILDGFNIYTGTTTGTILGATTSQKLSLWAKTPVVQPTTAIASATRVGGGGTTVTDIDTFGGYKIAQVVQALQNIGILA